MGKGRKNNYPKNRKPPSEETKAKIKASMKKLFSGNDGDKHRERMADTANMRWNLI